MIKDKNGKMITDQDEVKRRWTEYFQELYYPKTATDQRVLDALPEGGRSEDIPANIMRVKVEADIRRLKNNKAPGIDNITVKEIQAAGNSGIELMLKLCCKIWREEKFPQLWKKAIIVPLYKNKKDKLSCDNYRGISLLSDCGKVMTSILFERLKQRTEEILSEAQAIFRPRRSTIDQLFTLRRLAEKFCEFSRHLYVCYVNFKKAFGSVWQIGLWKVIRFLGYADKIVRLL